MKWIRRILARSYAQRAVRDIQVTEVPKITRPVWPYLHK